MTDSGTFRNHELDPRTALDSLTRIFGSGIHSGSGIHPPPPRPFLHPPKLPQPRCPIAGTPRIQRRARVLCFCYVLCLSRLVTMVGRFRRCAPSACIETGKPVPLRWWESLGRKRPCSVDGALHRLLHGNAA